MQYLFFAQELREVLQEHDWSFHEALEALKLFAEDEQGKVCHIHSFSKSLKKINKIKPSTSTNVEYGVYQNVFKIANRLFLFTVLYNIYIILSIFLSFLSCWNLTLEVPEINTEAFPPIDTINGARFLKLGIHFSKIAPFKRNHANCGTCVSLTFQQKLFCRTVLLENQLSTHAANGRNTDQCIMTGKIPVSTLFEWMHGYKIILFCLSTLVE